MRKVKMLCLMLSLLILTGCKEKYADEKPKVLVQDYEQRQYQTESVQKGDISSQIELSLKQSDITKIDYMADIETQDVESIEVNVAVGDYVNKGDVMIRFESGGISTQIEKYENQIEQNKLMIEHYQNLKQIENTTDYDENLRLLNEDIEVAQLYIKELNATLDSYSIIAKESGTVSKLSDMLAYGYVLPGENLVTVLSGSGEYKASTNDEYPFNVGDIYTVEKQGVNYDMELINIEEGGGTKNLTFRSAQGNIPSMSEAGSYNLVIEKPAFNGVLYISEDCLNELDEGYFVYRVDEDGFKEAVAVKVKEIVDGYAIIEAGLEEGEKVTLR